MANAVGSLKSHRVWALKIACLSRLLVIFLQFLAPLILPKHDNDGFKSPAVKDEPSDTEGVFFIYVVVRYFFKGLLHWDGQYFLHIATEGYTAENMYAFFPLFPKSVQLISTIFYYSTFGLISSFTSLVIVVGLFVNFLLFVDAVATLCEILESSHETRCRNLTEMAIYLFAFNPASIFFSAFYSEAMFVNWTVRMFRALQQENIYRATSYAALSALTRSNGTLNAGFVIAHIARAGLQKAKLLSMASVKLCVKGFTALLGCWSLFMLYQVYCWIHMDIPARTLPYQYIQRKYWDVGLFRYFEIKQLPNFLMAFPVLTYQLAYSLKSLRKYAKHTERIRDLDLYALAPMVHALFLAFFCFTSMHVQVSTRLILSSCPYLYLHYATVMQRDLCLFRSGKRQRPTRYILILMWYISYFVVGTILFSQGYPWT